MDNKVINVTRLLEDLKESGADFNQIPWALYVINFNQTQKGVMLYPKGSDENRVIREFIGALHEQGFNVRSAK
jgi:hypothetical protein